MNRSFSILSPSANKSSSWVYKQMRKNLIIFRESKQTRSNTKLLREHNTRNLIKKGNNHVVNQRHERILDRHYSIFQRKPETCSYHPKNTKNHQENYWNHPAQRWHSIWWPLTNPSNLCFLNKGIPRMWWRRGWRKQRWRRWSAAPINWVIKNVLYAMNSNSGSKIKIRVKHKRIVEGKVGSGSVGDKNWFFGKQRGETRQGLEEKKVGEREALRDNVIRENEGV